MPKDPVKFDKDKPRTDLLPTLPLLKTAEIFGYGAKKYSDYNYRRGKGLKYSRMYGAELRHLFEWWNGRDKDPESGENPIYHAICELLMLADCIERGKGIDDRPKAAN